MNHRKLLALIGCFIVSTISLSGTIILAGSSGLAQDSEYAIGDLLGRLRELSASQMILRLLIMGGGVSALYLILTFLYVFASSAKRRIVLCIIAQVLPFAHFPLSLYYIAGIGFFLVGMENTLSLPFLVLGEATRSIEKWQEISMFGVIGGMGIWTICWIMLLAVELWEKRKAQQRRGNLTVMVRQ